MVREKAMFGNPMEARKFCKGLRKKGGMLAWIKESGGKEYIEAAPRYKRIPSEEEIINEIYTKGRVRSERMTRQKEVRSGEERSDELRSRRYGITNITNFSSFATRFARRRTWSSCAS